MPCFHEFIVMYGEGRRWLWCMKCGGVKELPYDSHGDRDRADRRPATGEPEATGAGCATAGIWGGVRIPAQVREDDYEVVG
jgi:hypothetical protein